MTVNRVLEGFLCGGIPCKTGTDNPSLTTHFQFCVHPVIVDSMCQLLYSYRSPLAVRYGNDVFVNSDLEHYSVTTQRHLNKLVVLTRQHGLTVYTIPFTSSIRDYGIGGRIDGKFANCEFPGYQQCQGAIAGE